MDGQVDCSGEVALGGGDGGAGWTADEFPICAVFEDEGAAVGPVGVTHFVTVCVRWVCNGGKTYVFEVSEVVEIA